MPPSSKKREESSVEVESEIKKLANDIEDIADPSSFDKVLNYFEQLQHEADEFMALLVTKLEYSEITWEQPWYQQGRTSLTKQYPPYCDRNETETETVKFRTDKITKDEHDRINNNWKRFVEEYNVPNKMRIFASWRNYNYRNAKYSPEESVRQFVIAYLARGLERTVHQIFSYVKYFNLREYETRAYTKYEEKIMEVCFLHKMEKAPSILAVVLGRHVRGIYKRRDVVKTGKPEKRRVKWNLARANKLLKLMLEHSGLTIDELKDQKFDKPFWMKLQEPMGRDYVYLYWFWNNCLHVQLFVKCDVKLFKLRKKIFKILRESSYKIWSDIRWTEIEKQFPEGFTRQFLYKMCFSIVRKHPRYSKTPVVELANFGLEKIKSKCYKNKRLKRLTLNEEGNLERIKYKSIEENVQVQ